MSPSAAEAQPPTPEPGTTGSAKTSGSASTSGPSSEVVNPDSGPANPQSQSPSQPQPSQPPQVAPEPALRPLTPAEFRVYNSLAERMDLFHASFRRTWNTLWTAACSTGTSTSTKNNRALLAEGLAFVRHLTVHHSIEEEHIFPVLARRMPEFQNSNSKHNGGGAAELLRQHREIHKGMDVLDAYLRACVAGEQALEMPVLKAKMESWGAVLWTHLDQEVRTLGADNMRKYWTMDEIRRIPM